MANRKGITVKRMMLNFTERYGQAGLRRLVERAAAGDSMTAIGASFGVSRERARQWVEAFGNMEVSKKYTPHPVVANQLDMGPKTGKQLALSAPIDHAEEEEE